MLLGGISSHILEQKHFSSAHSATTLTCNLIISRVTCEHIQEKSLSGVSTVSIIALVLMFFKDHKLPHTGEKPHKCDQCSYSGRYLNSLKNHILSHTGEKPFGGESGWHPIFCVN